MTAASDTKDHHEGVGHVAPLWILLSVFGALMVLTALTVGVAYIDLGNLNLMVAMGVAVVKATFVVLYFMHLRWDKPFNAVVFIGALLFLALFVLFALLDTLQYAPDEIPGYAPGLEAP